MSASDNASSPLWYVFQTFWAIHLQATAVISFSTVCIRSLCFSSPHQSAVTRIKASARVLLLKRQRINALHLKSKDPLCGKHLISQSEALLKHHRRFIWALIKRLNFALAFSSFFFPFYSHQLSCYKLFIICAARKLLYGDVTKKKKEEEAKLSFGRLSGGAFTAALTDEKNTQPDLSSPSPLAMERH